MQKPFPFQTDITFRAAVIDTDERPNGVLVTIELNKLSEHERPSRATRLIAVIPRAIWAQGPNRIAPMLKLAIASEMNSCFILRSLERSGQVLVMPKSGVDDIVGVRVVSGPAPDRNVPGMFAGIFESFGRGMRDWLHEMAVGLDATDGRAEGAAKIGVGQIHSPFPYGPGKTARDAWFSEQNEQTRMYVADLQRQIESLQTLADMGKQTEVQRLGRIASKLSDLTGAELPDNTSCSGLERWITDVLSLNLKSADVGVVRKAELTTALRVAAIVFSRLGITMPLLGEDDTVTSLARSIADMAASEIERRDESCDEARLRIDRIASEVERVSGERFGIPVRTDPLLEDYAIRWVRRMRKQMVSSEIMQAVLTTNKFPGLRNEVTTDRFLPQDQRKDPIDAFWAGFATCEQRVAGALLRSFEAGGSPLGNDVAPTDARAPHPLLPHPLLDLFDTIEISQNDGTGPVAFSAVRTWDDTRVFGVIHGEATSVEAQIKSLESAQSKKALLRKRWANQRGNTLRFVIDHYEFCTARSDAAGRTCVIVTLSMSVIHDEPQPPNNREPQPEPNPSDVSAEIAAIFDNKKNDILTILNPSSGNIVRIMGQIQVATDQRSGVLVLHGAICGRNEFVMAALNELSDIKNNGTLVTVKRLWDPKDSPFNARIVSGKLTTCTPKQPSPEDESEVLVVAELEAEPTETVEAAQGKLIRIQTPGTNEFVQVFGTLSESMELDAHIEAKHQTTEEAAANLQAIIEKTAEVWVYTYPHIDSQGTLARFAFLGFKSEPGKPWKTRMNITAKLSRVDTVSFSCPHCTTTYVIEREEVTGKEAVVKCQSCSNKLWVFGDGTTMPCVGPTSGFTNASIFRVSMEKPIADVNEPLCGYPHDSGLDCKRQRSKCMGVNVPHESVLPDKRIVGFTSECGGLFVKPTGEEVKWKFGQFATVKIRRHMTDLEIAQHAAIFVAESTDIVRNGWASGIDSQVILEKLSEEEPIAHDTHVHYAAALGFALGIKHAQGEESSNPDIVRFSCGTCAKRYSTARDAIGAKNLFIRCANCNAQLEVTPVGAVVVERGTVPKSGTNESNNQPIFRETPRTEERATRQENSPKNKTDVHSWAGFWSKVDSTECSMVVTRIDRHDTAWIMRGFVDGPIRWHESGAAKLDAMREAKAVVDMAMFIGDQSHDRVVGRIVELKVKPAPMIPHPSVPNKLLVMANVEVTFLESSRPKSTNDEDATKTNELLVKDEPKLSLSRQSSAPKAQSTKERGLGILFEPKDLSHVACRSQIVPETPVQIDRTLLFRGKPVEPGSAEWTAVANRAQVLDVETANSKIAAHESSAQIHFEDLSNGEIVNDGAIIAILTRGDDDDGCRSWSLIGSLEGEPEWVSKVQGKLERLDETKGHVMIIVRPHKGKDYTIRARLYGTNISPAVPSQYDFGVVVRTNANIYVTIIEAKVPPVEPHGAHDPCQEGIGLTPVTPRSQRDPDDLARIEARPKNLRTIVEDAHELLSQYGPSEDADDPDFFATEKARRTNPLLHRIRLLGDAWQKQATIASRVLSNYDTKPSNCPAEELALGHHIAEMMTGQSFDANVLAQPEVRAYFRALCQVLREVHADTARANNPFSRELSKSRILSVHDTDATGSPKAPPPFGQPRIASFYKPIVLEYERHEVPELLFRGKPISPTDPEWAELVATIQVLESQAFPLVQVTVKAPKERIDTNLAKIDCKVTVDGKVLAEQRHHAAAQMRPEDGETQAALNNVEDLLRGTDVSCKEPEPRTLPNEPPAQSADFKPGDSVLVMAVGDAFCGMVGEFESRDDDGRYRVRFKKHGGISIVFARSEIELDAVELGLKAEVQGPAVATSLQPDPTAIPHISEAEANMARKLDEGHQHELAVIASLNEKPRPSYESPYGPTFWEEFDYPPTVAEVRPSLSSITDREELAARARDLIYTPGEPGTLRRAALAEMVARDPQMAEDVAVVEALIGDSTAPVGAPSRVGQAVTEEPPTTAPNVDQFK